MSHGLLHADSMRSTAAHAAGVATQLTILVGEILTVSYAVTKEIIVDALTGVEADRFKLWTHLRTTRPFIGRVVALRNTVAPLRTQRSAG